MLLGMATIKHVISGGKWHWNVSSALDVCAAAPDECATLLLQEDARLCLPKGAVPTALDAQFGDGVTGLRAVTAKLDRDCPGPDSWFGPQHMCAATS